MTRLRTYDPLLGNCRRLRRLAVDGGYHESSVLVLIVVAAFVAVMVALLWAAWTLEAQGVGPRGDTLNRGGGMPVAGPVAVGTARSPRGASSLPAEAAEIPRAGGEESGGGLPGVGADPAVLPDRKE